MSVVESRWFHRLLEIMPGLVSWSLILFPVWGSLVIPVWVAYFIILFDVYWLYRSSFMAGLAIIAYFKIKAYQLYDWIGDVKGFGDWRRLNHVILIPTYQEPLYILTKSLNSLAKQSFPIKNLHVVVSFEQREGKSAREKASKLRQLYQNKFGSFLTTFHPDIEGEVKGKSSNTAWAMQQAIKRIIKPKQLATEYLTVTSEDADARFHPQYFACVSYKFLDHPHRYNLIFQSAIMYYNNIWQVPAPVRVFSTISSIVQIGMLVRRDRLINFSTYTTSYQLLEKIGFWDVDVIPEDYRLFFKAYFGLEGKAEVEPIYLPTFADAVQSTGYWRTLVNQYQQVKRWAWGVSDDPYFFKRWLTSRRISWVDKTLRVFKVIEDHFLWPVNWFIVTLGATLPPLLNENFSRTIIGKRLPQTSSLILTFSVVALLIIVLIDFRQRPKIKRSWWQRVIHSFEFLLLPVVGFFFTALPGLDAHTRLMLGRYIEYKVTEKV